MSQIPHAYLQNVQAGQRQCFPRAWCQKAVPALTWVKKRWDMNKIPNMLKFNVKRCLKKNCPGTCGNYISLTWHEKTSIIIWWFRKFFHKKSKYLDLTSRDAWKKVCPRTRGKCKSLTRHERTSLMVSEILRLINFQISKFNVKRCFKFLKKISPAACRNLISLTRHERTSLMVLKILPLTNFQIS